VTVGEKLYLRDTDIKKGRGRNRGREGGSEREREREREEGERAPPSQIGLGQFVVTQRLPFPGTTTVNDVWQAHP